MSHVVGVAETSSDRPIHVDTIKAYIFYALPFLETVIAYCGCFDNLVILFFHAFNLTKCVGVLVNLAEK